MLEDIPLLVKNAVMTKENRYYIVRNIVLNNAAALYGINTPDYKRTVRAIRSDFLLQQMEEREAIEDANRILTRLIKYTPKIQVKKLKDIPLESPK